MADDDSNIRIELEDSGEVWTKVEEFTIRESWFDPSDQWSATVYDYESHHPRELRRRFQPKTRVRIYFGDRLQVIGSIEKNEDVGGGSTALHISGYDYLFRLVKAGMDPSVQILNTMTLETALLEGLRALGITKIETSIDAVRTAKMGKPTFAPRSNESLDLIRKAAENQIAAGGSAAKLSAGALFYFGDIELLEPSSEPVAEAKPQPNESAYEWAARLCARSGYAIQPGSDRNSIAVVRPDYRVEPAYELSRPGNIEDATTVRDWEDVPTYVSMRSRRATAEFDQKNESKSITPVGDDSEIGLWRIPECRRILEAAGATAERIPKDKVGDPKKLYVPAYFRDDDARTLEKLTHAARRFTADHIRDTLNYDCSLKGFTYAKTGVTYAINNLAKVSDENSDVEETLWIYERVMSFGHGRGESTQLKMLRPGSYII